MDDRAVKTETFVDAFDALTATRAEAANLKVRADMMAAIRDRVKSWNVTEGDAAKRLGITRPRLNDLMRGKLEKFSLDALVNIAASAGFVLHIELADVA